MMAEVTKKVSNFTKKTRETFWKMFDTGFRKWTMGMIFGVGLFITFYFFNTSVNFAILAYTIGAIYGIYVTGHTMQEIKNPISAGINNGDSSNQIQSPTQTNETKDNNKNL